MPTLARVTFKTAIGFLALIPTACAVVPQSALRECQCRSMALNQQFCAERDQMMAERQHLEQSLASANQRLDNLQAERAQLHQRYISLLNKAGSQPSPLSDRATQRLKELQKRYPDFEFDPVTGVSKFHSDILFDSGSAEIKQSAHNLLHEFAQIMNGDDAQNLKILVVGHTDDKPISKQRTAAHHPTNWHLSTNRADSVVLALSKSGVRPARMGATGYGEFQPLVPNKDEASRQKNRRVEIFVLAPDATVAGWDPATSRN